MKKRLTTNVGTPISDNQNSLTAGKEGPTLLEDYPLIEKIAHFDRERVPERVVHARGVAAHGTFQTVNSMKKYTKAKFLQTPGTETPVFARFSLVIHGSHSPETLRDPRGFAVKFYTEEGNWDFVGNNLPVFFIRDAMKFPDVIHALKPAPDTNLQDPTRYWDFFSLTPESMNMLLFLFSDEGTPINYRHIRGSSVHAFKWVNEFGNTTYVKLRWLPRQGLKNMSAEEAEQIQGKDFSHATRDFITAIQNGDYPQWDLYVQFLNPADMDSFDFNPLDTTKEWYSDVFPYHHVGTMTLHQNPTNVFAETESVAFNPGSLVPGMMPSEDKMLQGRLFSYADTQRYRIGTNYLHLPINCPFAFSGNYQRDGSMPFRQQLSTVNYEPNSYMDTPKEDPSYTDPAQPLNGVAARQKIAKTNDYGQARETYLRFTEAERAALIKNLTNDLRKVTRHDVLLRVLIQFHHVEPSFAQQIAQNLQVDITPYIS